MSDNKARPTTDELYAMLKNTSLPTVLVEGKDDIVFYRRVEEDLRDFGVDMLPAGNKGAVLELYQKISDEPISSPVVFIVDNDLWVYGHADDGEIYEQIITTKGYSIENDLYLDGELEGLLTEDELMKFRDELAKFTHWYALAVDRRMRGIESTFRTHPGKILDDNAFYQSETTLFDGESYPVDFLKHVRENYSSILRGKSLFALLIRGLSAKQRRIKYSVMQLMEFGASRKGVNYQRMSNIIRERLESAPIPKEMAL